MKKVTLVMLALTAVMQLPAQEQGRTLSLEEALEMTLSDNPAIRAAEFNRRAAQQERRAAIGLRMPQIGITGSYAYLGKDIEIDLNNMKAPVQNLAGQILQSGMIPSDYIPSISQMLSGAMAASWALPLQDRSLGFVGGDVTVPLWMGGKINAANRAARINEQTARSQGIQQRNALVSELVERYYGLALARQVVVVRQQVVDGVRKHLEDAAALEAQGMISRSEKLYVEFKMSEAERDLQNAQSQVETIAAALNSTIGQTDDYQPVTAMFILERIEPLDHFRTLAAERNPLLDQVDQKRRLAYEGVRAQRSSFLPQVVAMGGMSFYDYQVSKVLPRWAVGVGVNFKLLRRPEPRIQIFGGQTDRTARRSVAGQSRKRHFGARREALQPDGELPHADGLDRGFARLRRGVSQNQERGVSGRDEFVDRPDRRRTESGQGKDRAHRSRLSLRRIVGATARSRRHQRRIHRLHAPAGRPPHHIREIVKTKEI